MRAIVVSKPGGPDVLSEQELPDPTAGPHEVVIDVAAAGVNRADVSQRQGNYPPPAGSPSWPGLEVSGTISSVGHHVEEWAVGDEVCALLAGGGYATRVVANSGQVMPVPAGIDLVDAAALPEAVATVWSNAFLLAGLRAGDTLLVHGGSSGIGTMAVQLARAFGCSVAVTARSAEKLAACERLGADILINYREEDFVAALLDATGGRGADVILDPVGGAYLDRNIRCLARLGRLVLIGNQSGVAADFGVSQLMSRWASIHATSLRARPLAEKDEIIRSVIENVWPLVAAGQVLPVVHERIPLAEAGRAHELLESSTHIGKLLLVP